MNNSNNINTNNTNTNTSINTNINTNDSINTNTNTNTNTKNIIDYDNDDNLKKIKVSKIKDFPLKTRIKLDTAFNNTIKNIDKTDLKKELDKVGYKTNNNLLNKKRYKEYFINKFSEAGITKEYMISKFDSIGELALKDKDFTNSLRANENIAKISGLMKDNINNNVIVFDNSIQDSLEQVLKSRIIDNNNQDNK